MSAVHRSPRRPACTTPQPDTSTTHAAESWLFGHLLESAAGQADYSDVSLSPDLIELALCKLRSNESVSATARALGISRAKLYRAAERHAELKALLPTNAGNAAPRTPPQPASPPESNEYPDAGDQPLTSFEADLDRAQIAELVRAIHRCGNLSRAVHEVGITLHPRRLRPKDIPVEARNLMRRALQIVEEAGKPKPPSQEAELLAAWVRGAPWPVAITLDAVELRRLSPRAADDLERTIRARALVAARHERRAKRDGDGSPWEAF